MGGGEADDDAASINPTTARRMRGLLNKLTEQNINGVSSELADLLGSGGGGSRALCMSLAQSMLSSCASEAQLLAPLVLLHAALARALSIRLGQNVVTALVEATVSTFEKAEKKAAERRAAEEASEHARSNCALLLAHLYNFGALHVSLMYELVRKLVAAFGGERLHSLPLCAQPPPSCRPPHTPCNASSTHCSRRAHSCGSRGGPCAMMIHLDSDSPSRGSYYPFEHTMSDEMILSAAFAAIGHHAASTLARWLQCTHISSNSVYPPPTPLSPTNSSLLARPLLARISPSCACSQSRSFRC